MSNVYHKRINLRRILDSVVTRLLLLALCIITLGMVVRYFTLIRFLHEDLGNAVEGQQFALSRYIAHEIDQQLIQRKVVLKRLSSDLPGGLLQQPQRLHVWLNQKSREQSLFGRFAVVNDRGQILASTTPAADTAQLTQWAQNHRPGLSPVIGPLPRPLRTPAWLPVLAAIPQATPGRPAFLIGFSALANPGLLDGLQPSPAQSGQQGLMLMAPEEHWLIKASASGLVLQPLPQAGTPPLLAAASQGPDRSDITTSPNGSETVFASIAVPQTGWRVVSHLPGSVAFSAIHRAQVFFIRNATLAIGCFALITGLGLYLVFRPLFHAASLADRMSRGELPLEPLTTLRNDEVGHLIAAFNRLLGKLRLHQAELARMVHHDPLTGLPNRMLLSDRLKQVLAQAQHKQDQVGLLFLDLDGFKQINDTLGHQAGDEALRQIALRLSKTVRNADTLARIGGDEFVLLLSELGHDAEQVLHRVATQCINALHAPIPVAGKLCQVGVSIGIALGSRHSSSNELMRAADQAMYQAKKTGGGFVSVTLANADGTSPA